MRTTEKLAPIKARNRLVLGRGEKNMWQKNVVEYHELLKQAGELHTNDDALYVPHYWDTKWMAPTIEALMKLVDAGKADKSK